MAEKFGVRVHAEVARNNGAENKFSRQLQQMADQIPESKLPKVAVQLDVDKTRQIFQRQLKDIFKSFSLDGSKVFEQQTKAIKQTNDQLKKQEGLLEANRIKVQKFIAAAQQQLSKAIAKYDYGDATEAHRLMQQFQTYGVLNFKDLGKASEEIAQFQTQIDTVVAALKKSHKANLAQINLEIAAEAELAKQAAKTAQEQVNWIDVAIEKRKEEASLFAKQLQEQMKADVQAQKAQAKLEYQINRQRIAWENWQLRLKDTKKYESAIKGINKLFDTAQTEEDLKKIILEIEKFKHSAKEAGDVGLSIGEKFKNGLVKFAGWYGISRIVMTTVNAFKRMVATVIELDASLVEIQKVTELTGASLEAFTNQAFKAGSTIGRTGREMIDATAEFRKAGYELQTSMELAKAALITTNIGDGITDVTEASSALIAVLRGFNMDESKVMRVVDAINEVANTSPIGFENITEGLKRISGTLAQTGTTLEQTIGLLTGGFARLRDIEGVSSGLLMISQRLRGIDENGEAVEGLVPKLQQAFKSIANIDITDLNGELRSTYDILSDMARVFPSLTSQQRQYLAELAAGKTCRNARYVQKCA